MKILGFQKTTLLDFPGKVAATVFVGGCNFRCPFCHNRDLVLGDASAYSEEEILSYLNKRRGVLDGVCITGGEPTLQSDLEEFIRKVKELGLLVKLDTNGYRPEVLLNLLKKNLLDYVAMDVKASAENYGNVTGTANVDMDKINESIQLLKKAGIPYEFRTTVVKGLHTKEEFHKIGELLQGAEAYYLQGFRENENVIGEGCEAFSTEEMREILSITKKYIDKVSLRGVE